MQRRQVQDHQAQQRNRHRDHVQGEEAVQGGVRNEVVAADPFRQRFADHRNGAEQVDDHLCAPVRHLAPRQHVAEERLRHQQQVDQHAEDPHQFARRAVRTVQQAAEHVQVDHDEEERGAGGVHVADQPAPVHVAHDVFHRGEGLGRRRLVVHGQEDAGDDLDDQHQQGQRAHVVPEIEILRRVVLGQVRVPEFDDGQALVHPVQQRRGLPGNRACGFAHHATPSGLTPMISVWSSRKLYGGTVRLVGAGTALYTRPAMSNLDLWQGQ